MLAIEVIMGLIFAIVSAIPVLRLDARSYRLHVIAIRLSKFPSLSDEQARMFSSSLSNWIYVWSQSQQFDSGISSDVSAFDSSCYGSAWKCCRVFKRDVPQHR